MPDRMHSQTLCTARRKSGEPCRNYALLGANVCRMHGGSAPQVRRKAQVRLAMSADKLMGQLLEIASDTTVPASTRLSAIVAGLDRAGLGAKQEVSIQVELSTWEKNTREASEVIIEYIEAPAGEDEFADGAAEFLAYQRELQGSQTSIAEPLEAAPEKRPLKPLSRALAKAEANAVIEARLAHDLNPPQPRARGKAVVRRQP